MADPQHLGDDRWKVTVHLGRGADGRWRRKWRTFHADGIRAARRRAREIETELQAEASRTNLTFAQAAEDWWKLWAKRPRSPSTREDYRTIIDRWVLTSPLAGRPVAKITTGQLERWYAGLPVGPARVKRVHAVVTQVFNQCVRDGELVVNPAALAYKPEGRTDPRPFVAPETVAAIVRAAHAEHVVRGRALAFAGRTGLRRGEMAGLHWSRIDEEATSVLVDRSVIEVASKHAAGFRVVADLAGGRVLVEKDTKAHQAETIELEAVDLVVVEHQVNWQRAAAAAAGVKVAKDPYLWSIVPPFNEPLQPDLLGRWHRQACKAAGVSGVRLHDLRHHHGSVYMAAGATLAETQQRMRHKSMATTMGYVHPDRSRQRELLSRLAPLELPSGD